MEYKVEDWIVGKEKILFITGYSGSGKSTLADQMARTHNAYHIELDMVNINLKLMYGEDVYHGWTHPQYSAAVFHWLELWFLNERVVVEGGQVLKLDFNWVSKHSFIITKAGIIKSSVMAIIRDFKKEHWARYKSITPLYHIKKNLVWRKRLERFIVLADTFL
jgi:cytidylate kinase